MKLENVKYAIIAFFFGLIAMLIFNNIFLDIIGESTASEWRIMAKVVWLGICIMIGLAVPVAIGKKDTKDV